MGKSLVIVESPAKAKTLKKFLGKGFFIKSSVGHLIDLPKSKLGVDVENNFEPSYITIKGKGKILQELKNAAASADNIYLAPDPDREGEAIAWHIANQLDGKQKGKIYRVLFNQITKKAVVDAVKNPGEINKDKVDSQQARRILDRLVGYKISPILWKKVRRGLSAGRVQSVALRLICEREKEIEAFVWKEFWTIEAEMKGEDPLTFESALFSISGKKPEISSESEAAGILDNVKGADFIVEKVQKKERKRNPVPPFITSTLQQEAARKLRYSARKTMSIAQRLYEGLEIGEEGLTGLITYMRTDSTRIADEAISEVRDFVKNRYGSEYVPESPNVYKVKKASQDAHEAVRPTSAMREPASIEKCLSKEENNLYRLIWNRFVSSQMSKAILDTTSVDIKAKEYLFRASGSVVKFMGFMRVYTESKDEEKAPPPLKEGAKKKKERFLPPLKEGEALETIKIEKLQHFTQPPPRYSEASLIRELEEKGIGRPSTYAQILSVIRSRDYVTGENGRFKPSDLGTLVSDLLVKNFPKVVDVEFTARMETQLDDIEEGKKGWIDTLKEFYDPFEISLTKAESDMKNVKAEVELTDEVCEKCGGQMGIKLGRFGKFMACMNYPECKNTKEIEQKQDGSMGNEKNEEESTTEVCDKCDSPMKVKSGKFGKFLACSKYPDCKFTRSISTGVNCPECDGYIGIRHSKRGKTFYGCSNYPKCKFALWNKPVPGKCPECDYTVLVEKWSKDKNIIQCGRKGCAYKRIEEQEQNIE